VTCRILKVGRLLAVVVGLSGIGEAKDVAHVQIQVWTFAGERLKEAQISLLHPGTRIPYNDVKFRGQGASQVPYGGYLLRVATPGFRIFEQPIRVYQAHFAMRVLLSIACAEDCTEPTTLRG
jgi:hypothetical protein